MAHITNDTHENTLPETGFVRLAKIIGNPKAQPPIPAIIPVSKSTWWSGVRTGRFPRKIKLSPRITVWRVEDIRALISESSTPQDEQNSQGEES